MSEITPSDIDTLEAKADSNFALPADSRDAAVTKFLCQFYRGMVDPGFADKLAKDVADELRSIYAKEDAKAAGSPDKTPEGYPNNPSAICDRCGQAREHHRCGSDQCPGAQRGTWTTATFATGLRRCANCHQLYIRHHALAPHHCPANRDDGPITEFAATHWSPKP